MMPITMLPRVMSWPKALMTEPALPPLERISRVEDTFSPNRNSVVTSSSDGKMENSSASAMFMVISRITMDSEMLMMIRTSISCVGSGRIRNRTITTTKMEMMILESRRILVPPFLC